MSGLNLNQPGRHEAPGLKVVSVEPMDKYPKLSWVTFEGLPKKIKCWTDQLEKFPVKLAKGSVADAIIEVEEKQDNMSGDTIFVAMLKGFGGEPARGGFGGGKGFAPRDEAHEDARQVLATAGAIARANAEITQTPTDVNEVAALASELTTILCASLKRIREATGGRTT